jgi:CheY-like chemotaxis protein
MLKACCRQQGEGRGEASHTDGGERLAQGADVPARILAVVDDIFFLAKIQQTARQLGVTVEPLSPDALGASLAENGARGILLDLNHRSGKAIAALEGLKDVPATRSIPVVAFLSHVQTDLAQAARTAGCDRVMARSAFSQQLPMLLQELSREKDPSSQ